MAREVFFSSILRYFFSGWPWIYCIAKDYHRPVDTRRVGTGSSVTRAGAKNRSQVFCSNC